MMTVCQADALVANSLMTRSSTPALVNCATAPVEHSNNIAPSITADLKTSLLDLDKIGNGQRGRIQLRDEERVGNVRSNETGNRRLARAGLSGQPIGAPGKPALGERSNLRNDLVLPYDVVPCCRSILFGQLHRCFSLVCGLFRARLHVV